MKFEKKLIIMIGRGDCKGTASLERNGYGMFVTVSVYNAPDLKSGEYYFGIKTNAGAVTRSLGSLGRGAMRFKIEDISLDDCHAFVFESKNMNIIMYGTSSGKKLWEGNLLDGIRREHFEKEQTNNVDASKEKDIALPNYSARSQKTEATGGLFWDIVPPIGGYIDDTIAEVNYYPSNLTFSKAEPQTAATTNSAIKIDAAKIDEAQTSQTNIVKNSSALSPSEMERRYLFRYRNNNFYNSVRILQNENIDNNENITDKSDNKNFLKNNINHQSELPKVPPKTIDNNLKIPPPNAFTAQDAVKTIRTKTRFYERAAKQIDELFKTNPRYEQLEKLMPATKWVKVEYNNSGKYYVVGIIGNTPDYLCYGVPASYSAKPPIDLEGYSAFLPIDPSKPQGNGFWLMYQDADSGESVTRP